MNTVMVRVKLFPGKRKEKRTGQLCRDQLTVAKTLDVDVSCCPAVFFFCLNL